MKRIYVLSTLIILLAGAGLAAVSCGGGSSTTSSGYSSYSGGSSSYSPYPARQYYEVYLKVADKDGNPVSGVTVWFDGDPADDKTWNNYTTLGDGYPESWQGWKTNYISDYRYVIIDYEGDTDDVLLRVSKSGYDVADVTLNVYESRYGNTLMYRYTFIMEPEQSYLLKQ